MTDPRRVVHAASAGLRDAGALGNRPNVVVVGAGVMLGSGTGLLEGMGTLGPQ